MNHAANIDRRSFVASAAALGGGFALGFEIPQEQFLLQSHFDPRRRSRDLARNKCLAAPRALVVK